MDGAASRRQILLCASWVLGAALIAVASIEYLWRSSHTPLFVWLSVVGGALLALAVLSTALLVLGAGSRLSVVGCVTLVVGWLTLFFGVGAILALAGFVLYVAGLVRTRVVERRSLYQR